MYDFLEYKPDDFLKITLNNLKNEVLRFLTVVIIASTVITIAAIVIITIKFVIVIIIIK